MANKVCQGCPDRFEGCAPLKETRRKVVEEVWKMLGDFRKYSPYNIGADAAAVRSRLIEIGGEDCKLEI